MSEILVRAGCFCAIIMMGFILKKASFFRKEDFALLSKIVIRITLTCAVVNSFNGKRLDGAMLLMSVFGFAFGLLLIGAALLFSRGASPRDSAFTVLNTAGVNIGNFVLPFAQSFLGPEAVMAVCLFDVGNSFFCLGGSYGIASSVLSGGKGFRLRTVFAALTRSVPFITYVVMTALCFLGWSLPAPVLEFTGIVGGANAFLAMLMLGVGFNISLERSKVSMLLRILATRYSLGIGLSLAAWNLLPFPLAWRQALSLLFLGPIASAAPAYTAQMDGDYELASAVNSFSIVIAMALIVFCLTRITS